ncbi:MAG: DUF1080 domain-containing protein [Candidatus Omnitrophica bacterium]|nr:DUF1080 domain-containing protein [Candidatus Omnitrophota bacterium]
MTYPTRIFSAIFVLCFVQCQPLSAAEHETDPAFQIQTISEQAEMWWARALVDINNDGLLDIALQNNNAHGGWLGWLETQADKKNWKRHIIAETAPNGETFACGDLDAGDIDNDGDIDIFAFAHPGEWDEGGAPTTIYWYENPSWTAHRIGQAPAFVKDVNAADFNGDGRLDLVAITFVQNMMTIFRQDSPTEWKKVQSIQIKNLHEGMDVGDIDGDGDLDVAAAGYWVENPGGNLESVWPVHIIDKKWNTQDGDWSRNATKVFCRDIDNDQKAEVFISHSERKGYPVSMYKSQDPKSGDWSETVLHKDLAAAHTLQVFDFDGDGDYDALAGVNMNRAKGIEVDPFPAILFLNQGDAQSWRPIQLTDGGIYNGQAADLEGDGDIDIFRLPTHDGTVFESWINQTNDRKRIGVGAHPPEGADILIDGTRELLDEKWTYWEGPRFSSSLPIKWKITDDPADPGKVVAASDPAADGGLYGAADIVTKKKYRDFRLHIEFLVPHQGGNSGVYLQNRYEIQILDGDGGEHGMAAVINEAAGPYHAYRGTGKWNAYDIQFRAARFNDGDLVEKAMVTMYFNGIKAHTNHSIQQVWGGANSGIDGGNQGGKGITDVPGGLKLQCEGHEVLYRNAWIQELDLEEPDTDF